MRLENWHFGITELDPYTPPECAGSVLGGEVYGHPNFNDGDKVTTSRLVEFDPKGKVAITASGSVYELGAPKKEWVSWLREFHKDALKNIDSFL